MTPRKLLSPPAEPPDEGEAPLDSIVFALEAASGDVTGAAERLLDDAPAELAEVRIDRERDRLAILKEWRVPLDGLDLLIAEATEAGEEWNIRFGEKAFADVRLRAIALHQLWASSITVGTEVLALMNAGLGLGAFARWRTLHEIQVVARVIGMGDDATAGRFLDREDLRNAAATLRWQSAAERDRRLDEVPEAVIADARAARKEVRRLNESSIRHDFGWAHDFLIEQSTSGSSASSSSPSYAEAVEKDPKRVPRFGDLQTAVGLGTHDPEFADASLAVHASPVYGARHLPPELRGTLFGPTRYGLDRAGGRTAEAVADITSLLLRVYPDPPDHLLASAARVLEELADLVGGDFDEVGLGPASDTELSTAEG